MMLLLSQWLCCHSTQYRPYQFQNVYTHLLFGHSSACTLIIHFSVSVSILNFRHFTKFKQSAVVEIYGRIMCRYYHILIRKHLSSDIWNVCVQVLIVWVRVHFFQPLCVLAIDLTWCFFLCRLLSNDYIDWVTMLNNFLYHWKEV